MSQFDFPRVNFSGQAFINPGTANNNILLPLVTYDPIQIRAFLPPRIYLSTDLLALHKLGGLPVPPGQVIREDGNQRYIDLEPINTRQTFTDWATTPLGSSPLDTAYHALYELVTIKRTGKPLRGHLPAGWNYYGGMEFGFRDVRIRSVATTDEQLFTPESATCPSTIARLLDAVISFDNDAGQTTAVMIDVLPSLAMFSQVFCDSIRVRQPDSVLLSGRPYKGSLRHLNLHRIVNQAGVFSSSGTFFMALPLKELDGGPASPLMRLFQEYNHRQEPLAGVLIRYNLFEVQENQHPDYSALGTKANPATATVSGSLTPWYEGELKSMTMGRILVPDKPYLSDKTLSSVVCRVDHAKGRVRLDLLGSIPETQLSQQPLRYETYPLGALSLDLIRPGRADVTLGTFQIDTHHLSRERLLQTGGVLDIVIDPSLALTEADVDKGLLAIRARSARPDPDDPPTYLLENEYMAIADESGLYTDQGQDASRGYRSYGPGQEPCRVSVYRRGQPLTEPVPMTIMALTITQSGSSAAVSQFLKTSHFQNGQALVFPTDQAANCMYVFYPGASATVSDNLLADLIRTGFFVSLRILPAPDYGPYLNPAHPDYPQPIPFDFLYQELLMAYDLVFPKASLITPFTEAYFSRGWPFIWQRMDPANWSSATYMPSSRDMPMAKWQLFCQWVSQLQSQSLPPGQA
ncbi:hypothetical protein [Spirosoma sordidisoli]|uniref:Uncharacterized protein n=1 Tax=Spirosoma sordidisoli TaxID=2502893 RepID=A0A4Q2UGX1_9BACT|nr:hypothetical protein [Spirosoma sordidisoli]RYC67722.1 hypothetical protein EQG79_23765 [Spirosoma sordidisoli]